MRTLGFWLFAALLAGGCSLQPVDRGRSPELASRAADIAEGMIGKPYRYGGNAPSGFDCSGLVQYSYGRAGVSLPRATDGLLRQTRAVSFGSMRRGDLVFFNERGRKASHVGIYLGKDEFVHAPSSGKAVHISSFNEDYWQRAFAAARRIDVY
jgi:cell wall-associated NlpC family hydrolase